MLDSALAVYESAIGRDIDRDRVQLYNTCALSAFLHSDWVPPRPEVMRTNSGRRHSMGANGVLESDITIRQGWRAAIVPKAQSYQLVHCSKSFSPSAPRVA
jgi:hypothetical protein